MVQKRKLVKKQFVQFDPNYTDEQMLEDIQKIQAQQWAKLEPPLTKEEDDYYMSLPQPDSSEKK